MEEEKRERSTAEGNIDDDNTEKRSDQCTMPVVESSEDKHPDLNEGLMTCNEVVEDKQPDPGEGTMTCVEDKQHDPIKNTVAYNENINPADGTITKPSIGELTKEQPKSENVRGREKSESPTDFLSGIAYCPQSVVVMILFYSTR